MTWVRDKWLLGSSEWLVTSADDWAGGIGSLTGAGDGDAGRDGDEFSAWIADHAGEARGDGGVARWRQPDLRLLGMRVMGCGGRQIRRLSEYDSAVTAGADDSGRLEAGLGGPVGVVVSAESSCVGWRRNGKWGTMSTVGCCWRVGLGRETGGSAMPPRRQMNARRPASTSWVVCGLGGRWSRRRDRGTGCRGGVFGAFALCGT